MSRADERWRKADRIFETALDLEPEARDAFIEMECGGDPELRALVIRLVAAAETEDSWLSPGGGIRPTALDSLDAREPEATDLTGRTVDRYRVLRELGRGGMAVVYLAERADGHFEHRVALKLIKRGVDTDEVVLRFERERQILSTTASACGGWAGSRRRSVCCWPVTPASSPRSGPSTAGRVKLPSCWPSFNVATDRPEKAAAYRAQADP